MTRQWGWWRVEFTRWMSAFIEEGFARVTLVRPRLSVNQCVLSPCKFNAPWAWLKNHDCSLISMMTSDILLYSSVCKAFVTRLWRRFRNRDRARINCLAIATVATYVEPSFFVKTTRPRFAIRNVYGSSWVSFESPVIEHLFILGAPSPFWSCTLNWKVGTGPSEHIFVSQGA